MRTLFADTGYFIALLHPRDALHDVAAGLTPLVREARIVTSEAVVFELLDAFAAPPDAPKGRRRSSPSYRRAAHRFVDTLARDPRVVIVPSSAALVRDSLRLYAERSDKTWGLTDCASFCVMRAKGIHEALAHDEHFVQAGFRALMRDGSE